MITQATRLQEPQDLTVQGHDLSAEARERLQHSGGTAVGTLAGSVRGADVVVLMLPDSNAVEAVADSSEFLAALDAKVAVDMSSSEPARTRALSKRLAARGTALVDAPVSGGVAKAGTGKLAVMVGGSDQDIARVEKMLSALGTVFRAGTVGAGHAVKALNNLISATHLLITAEAIIAGAQFGMDATAMLDIINASSGRSASTEIKWPSFILPETYDSGFALRLMLKDMRIASGLATASTSPSRLGDEAIEIWAKAAQDLPPSADHTEIVRWLRGGDRTTDKDE